MEGIIEKIKELEKIVHLCNQIKDLLIKNGREYIVGTLPLTDYPLPEYYKTIIGDLSEDSCDKLYDNTDDCILDDKEIYDEDYKYADKRILIIKRERLGVRFYILLAIRIENGDLVFCIEKSEGEDYDADFETVFVYESRDLSNLYIYGDAIDGIGFNRRVISCLEAYVRILSDETKSNICWKI
jgi:hypothetical protein